MYQHNKDLLYPLRHYFAAVNGPLSAEKAEKVASTFASDGCVIDHEGHEWKGHEGTYTERICPLQPFF